MVGILQGEEKALIFRRLPAGGLQAEREIEA